MTTKEKQELLESLTGFYNKVMKPDIRKEMLDILAEFYSGVVKPDIDKVNQRTDKLEQKLDDVIEYIKTKDSPSRHEFQGLKYKVEKLEASN